MAGGTTGNTIARSEISLDVTTCLLHAPRSLEALAIGVLSTALLAFELAPIPSPCRKTPESSPWTGDSAYLISEPMSTRDACLGCPGTTSGFGLVTCVGVEKMTSGLSGASLGKYIKLV